MKVCIIAFTILIAFNAITARVGTFIKDDLRKNDAYMNKALMTLLDAHDKQVFTRLTTIDDVPAPLEPIAVYKQLVNGFNFKFVFAIRANESKRIFNKFFTAVVYTGAFGNSNSNSQPEITSFEEIEQPETFLAPKSVNGLDIFLKEDTDIISYEFSRYFNVEGDDYFVIDANTAYHVDSTTQADIVICLNENEKFEKVKILENKK